MIEGARCEIRLGLPGCGKSLDQTENPVLDHLLNGEQVYCCYWLNWNQPNYHYFTPGDFEAIKNLRNCVVVFDELAQSFEPRDWENESKDVRRFFQLHRHHHVDIYANTQDLSLVAKTIGIVADEWVLCDRIERGWLRKGFLKLFGIEEISISKEYLNLQQLKKIANGWEIGEDVALDIETRVVNYKKEKLKHIELDEYKIELIHWHCDQCGGRQGEIILRGKTDNIATYNEKLKEWVSKEPKYCPKHPGELLKIKETGLYDTDYEPEQIERPYILKKYRTCEYCGQQHLVR